METKGPAWAAATLVVAVGLFVLLGFVSVASYATSAFSVDVSLPMLVVAGGIALLAAIAFTAIALSFFGLNDPRQALGLPDGSIRAIIALLLIVIFAILSVHFFAKVHTKDPAGVDLAKQIVTLLGTLVTSITSFYFGSRSAEATAAKPSAGTGSPTIIKVDPPTGVAGAKVSMTVTGTNLALAQAVSLRKQDKAIKATDVLSDASRLTCTFEPAADAEPGKWDVVVDTSDAQTVRLDAGFEVLKPG